MSQRLYFDFTDGLEVIRDEQGVEISVLDEAIVEVQSALTGLRQSGEADMRSDGWQLVIRDDSGMTLRSMPLDDEGFH